MKTTKYTKLSLEVAKKLVSGKSQQKRVALALRRFNLEELKDLKKELKELKQQIKAIREDIWAIKRFTYDD